MSVPMKDIKDFYKRRGLKVISAKSPLSGRVYKVSDDEPLSRQSLERRYLQDMRGYDE